MLGVSFATRSDLSMRGEAHRLHRKPRHSAREKNMEILYLLLPLSLCVVALIGGVLWWAVFSGQYDDPDTASLSILRDNDSTSTPAGRLSR